jgi:hypothetical protein
MANIKGFLLDIQHRKLLIFYISKFRQTGFKKGRKEGRKEERNTLSPERCILKKMVTNLTRNIPLCELYLERTDLFSISINR